MFTLPSPSHSQRINSFLLVVWSLGERAHTGTAGPHRPLSPRPCTVPDPGSPLHVPGHSFLFVGPTWGSLGPNNTDTGVAGCLLVTSHCPAHGPSPAFQGLGMPGSLELRLHLHPFLYSVSTLGPVPGAMEGPHGCAPTRESSRYSPRGGTLQGGDACPGPCRRALSQAREKVSPSGGTGRRKVLGQGHRGLGGRRWGAGLLALTGSGLMRSRTLEGVVRALTVDQAGRS